MDDDDEELCKVVMAVDMKDQGTIGCSYYSAQEEKLYVMEDIVYGGYGVIDICTWRLRTCLSCCLLNSLITSKTRNRTHSAAAISAG